MRAVEDPTCHIFDHNEMWEELLTALEKLSSNAAPLMEEAVILPSVPIKKDEVYTELFKSNPDTDDLTQEFLRLLCSSFGR